MATSRVRPPARNAPGDGRGPVLEYPLPKQVSAAWERVQGAPTPLNVGLVFDRFVANWGDPLDENVQRGRRDDPRRTAWSALARVVNRVDPKLIAACLERWRAVVARAQGRVFTLRTDWRLVTGLGSGGPLEVGFTFSRQGFPILPGSGLKGLARASGLRAVARAARLKDLRKLDQVLSAPGDLTQNWAQEFGELPVPEVAQRFRDIFGTTEAAGGAIFLDGMPTGPARLELDIMNPHFPDYYGGGDRPPSDDQNPRPVNFLAVAPGSEFAFAVGWRGRMDEEAGKRRAQAENWLRRGLIELGAGAKTSAGYGYFVAPK